MTEPSEVIKFGAIGHNMQVIYFLGNPDFNLCLYSNTIWHKYIVVLSGVVVVGIGILEGEFSGSNPNSDHCIKL